MLSAGAELLLVYRHMNWGTNQYQSVCKSGGGGYVFTQLVRGVHLFLEDQNIDFSLRFSCILLIRGGWLFTSGLCGQLVLPPPWVRTPAEAISKIVL